MPSKRSEPNSSSQGKIYRLYRLSSSSNESISLPLVSRFICSMQKPDANIIRKQNRIKTKPIMSTNVAPINSTKLARQSDIRHQKISYIQMRTIAIEANILILNISTSICIIKSTNELANRDKMSTMVSDYLKC